VCFPTGRLPTNVLSRRDGWLRLVQAADLAIRPNTMGFHFFER